MYHVQDPGKATAREVYGRCAEKIHPNWNVAALSEPAPIAGRRWLRLTAAATAKRYAGGSISTELSNVTPPIAGQTQPNSLG